MMFPSYSSLKIAPLFDGVFCLSKKFNESFKGFSLRRRAIVIGFVNCLSLVGAEQKFNKKKRNWKCFADEKNVLWKAL